MNLSVPNLEDKIDKIIYVSKSIVKSISDDLNEHKIFQILSRVIMNIKMHKNLLKN